MKKIALAATAFAGVLCHGQAVSEENDNFSCFVAPSDVAALNSTSFGIDDQPVSSSFVGMGDALNLRYPPERQTFEVDRSGVKSLAKADNPKGGLDILIETSLEKTKAALQYNNTQSRGGDLRILNVELSAPAADEGDSEITRIGDINTDVALAISYSWFGSTVRPTPNSLDIGRYQQRMLEACQRSADNKECLGLKAEDSVRALTLSRCVEKYLGVAEARKFRDELADPITALFFGASAEIGRKSFKYLDTVTGLDAKERHSPWSAEVYGGILSSDKQHIFRIGYERAEDYKDRDKRTICQAPGTGGLQECRTAPFGSPEQKDKEIAALEYRFLPQDQSHFVKGVAAKFSYDLESSEYEFDMPFYVFKSDKGDLNGGFRTGYSSEEDFYVAIFVGQKLGFGPGVD